MRRPGEVDPTTVGMVIVSSDSIESRLMKKAQAWADAAVPVVGLYDGLPAGPYDGSHDGMFERLAAGETRALTDEEVGEFAVVKRIGSAPGRAAGDTMPVPPRGARSGYDGPDEWYLRGGRAIAQTVLAACQRHVGAAAAGAPPRDILEWGCSSGRVLRHFPELVPGSRCWGCDIDAWSVNWAAANLVPPLKVFRSTTSPSLPLEAGSFDLVYAISVFTHLSDHFDAWLMELRRVLRPGGFLFVSINDEHVWNLCGREPGHYIAQLCPRLDFSRPMEDDFVTHGLGAHAQSFWHTRGVRRRWSFAMDVVEIVPASIDGVQTGVLLRRPLV